MEVPSTPDNIHLLTARAIFPRLEVAPAAVAGIKQLILLCFTNRCGSWLLADLLRTSGRIGVAGEALNGDEMARAADRGRLRDFSAFVAHEIAGKAVQGTVLLKCGLLHLELLGRSGLLDVLGGRVRFVHIERLDRLGQAISWVIAEQTGQWRSGGAAAGDPAYSFAGIAAAMERFAEDNRRFDHFFGRNGLVPVHVTYEALVQAPEAVAGAVVAGLFDVAPHFDMAGVMFSRQAGARNATWRALAERR